jgi:type II secretion system protein C
MRAAKRKFSLLISLSVLAAFPLVTLFIKDSLSVQTLTQGENSQEEQLPLRLLGTIIGSPSLAFIANSETGKNTICKVNSVILDYKITKISLGKVYLEKEGIPHELRLMSIGKRGLEEFAGDDATRTIVLNRSLILKELPRANELLSKIKVFPIAKLNSAQLSGFRIDNVPEGSIIEEVGIRSGDIICAVEGKELKSMEDAWKIFNTVKAQSSIEIALLREEKALTLKYHIRNQ